MSREDTGLRIASRRSSRCFIARVSWVERDLNAAKWMVAAVAASSANAAFAAVVALGAPLGEPLGRVLGGTALGTTLGNLLGSQLGSVLPLASVGLLGVSAASLAFGIYIVKHKKHR